MISEWFEKIVAILNYKASIKLRQWQDQGLSLDANDAIWFFGCSHVFGTGLEYNETAPYQLSRLLNRKVVNYGRPGIGPITIKHQIETLLKDYRPKAIIIAWPGFDRWQSKSALWIPHCLTDVKMHSDNFGCKKLWPEEWEEYKQLVISGEIRNLNLEAVCSVHSLVKEIPYVEFSYTTNDYNFKTPVFPFKDVAKDNCHPGINTQKQVAEWVQNELQLLL